VSLVYLLLPFIDTTSSSSSPTLPSPLICINIMIMSRTYTCIYICGCMYEYEYEYGYVYGLSGLLGGAEKLPQETAVTARDHYYFILHPCLTLTHATHHAICIYFSFHFTFHTYVHIITFIYLTYLIFSILQLACLSTSVVNSIINQKQRESIDAKTTWGATSAKLTYN
jgi:hypothetical protein